MDEMIPKEFVRIGEVVSGQEDCCLLRRSSIISLDQLRVGQGGNRILTIWQIFPWIHPQLV